jgi:hypothetical protein
MLTADSPTLTADSLMLTADSKKTRLWDNRTIIHKNCCKQLGRTRLKGSVARDVLPQNF